MKRALISFSGAAGDRGLDGDKPTELKSPANAETGRQFIITVHKSRIQTLITMSNCRFCISKSFQGSLALTAQPGP